MFVASKLEIGAHGKLGSSLCIMASKTKVPCHDIEIFICWLLREDDTKVIPSERVDCEKSGETLGRPAVGGKSPNASGSASFEPNPT